MERYYVIEISDGDAKIKGKGVYEYANLNEAIAVFHSKMGSAMKSALFKSELLLVINADGGVYKTEKYVNDSYAPTPEPTPEPDAE